MNELCTERLHALMHPQDTITKAVYWLKAGELIALPTETVYGLAAPIFNENAIAKIFNVKNRPKDNPLIIHCADLDDVHRVAINIPPLFQQLANHFLPGPLTIVLQKHPSVPNIVSAGLNTVAIRIPKQTITQEIIKQLGQPVVAPSANLSGYPSPTLAEHVLHDLGGKIAAVVDGGACDVGIESTIVNILTNPPQILRPGIITKAELAQATGVEFIEHNAAYITKAIAPGMKYKHYAPKAKIRLVAAWDEVFAAIENEPVTQRIILAQDKNTRISNIPIKLLSEHTLYAEFRNADIEGVQEILVVCDEKIRGKSGLINRLNKASEK